MSTVLSLKMAAVSWAGAAVNHSTAAAHSATRDIRSVRFMMPSSTAFGRASQEKERGSTALPATSKPGSRGTDRGAGGRTPQNQEFAAPADEFPAQAERFPAAPRENSLPRKYREFGTSRWNYSIKLTRHPGTSLTINLFPCP